MADTYAFVSANDRPDGPRGMQPGAILFNVPRLAGLLWLGLAIVLGLGIVREIIMAYLGTETVLRDLRHFALDAERSIPSWYEGLGMASASGLLAIIAVISRKTDSANRVHWTILAAIFLLMSLDEVVSFHEVTVDPLRTAFDLSGILYFSWVALAAPLVVALGLYFVPFLWRLPRATAVRFVVAGAVFVGGALGTEFLAGHFASTTGLDALPYRITAAVQECLESIGITLFVIALLRHLAQSTPSFQVTMQDAA